MRDDLVQIDNAKPTANDPVNEKFVERRSTERVDLHREWLEAIWKQIDDGKISRDHGLDVVSRRMSSLAKFSFRKGESGQAEVARLDQLTQLPNRRAYDEKFAEFLSKLNVEGKKFSLLILDIDRFKKFNDTYGHINGDRVLVSVANTVTTAIRQGEDFVSRWGGEELVFLINDAETVEDLEKTAEHIRNAIREIPVTLKVGDEDILENITVSIGGVRSKELEAVTPDTMYKLADRRLYQAKKSGRDRVVVSEIPPTTSE